MVLDQYISPHCIPIYVGFHNLLSCGFAEYLQPSSHLTFPLQSPINLPVTLVYETQLLQIYWYPSLTSLARASCIIICVFIDLIIIKVFFYLYPIIFRLFYMFSYLRFQLVFLMFVIYVSVINIFVYVCKYPVALIENIIPKSLWQHLFPGFCRDRPES